MADPTIYEITLSTQLIAVFTAFSAFTMPIALELLNRVKSKFGSPFYVDTVEKILGFRITSFIKQLFMFISVFTVYSLLASIAKYKFSYLYDYCIVAEVLFFSWAVFLLYREFNFLNIVYEVTKSDIIVERYIIDQLKSVKAEGAVPDGIYNLINLWVQIAEYNIEFSKVGPSKNTHSRMFKFIGDACLDTSIFNLDVVNQLLSELSKILVKSRRSEDRVSYITTQRSYGFHLINYCDSIDSERVNNIPTQNLYMETMKEIESSEHFLCTADFLLSTSVLILNKVQALYFIDKYINDLIGLVVDRKPEIICEMMDNYRNFNNYSSYFIEELDNFYHNNYDIIEHDEKLSSLKFKIENDYENILIENANSIVKNIETLVFNTLVAKDGGLDTKALQEEQDGLKSELMKGLGVLLAKRTAKVALAKLAEGKRWNDILLCLNKFDYSGTNIHMLGTRIYPDSYQEVLFTLADRISGQFDFRNEKVDVNYIQAVPLLVMQQIYSEFIGQDVPDFSLVNKINVNVGPLTLQQLNYCKKKLEKARYYSRAEVYAISFCSFHNIEHEFDNFYSSSILVFDKFIEVISSEIERKEKEGKISLRQKERFINEFVSAESDSVSDFPLLQFYIKQIKDKKPEILEENDAQFPRFSENYARRDFMDNTGVHHSFTHSYILRNIHYQLLFNLISQKGKLIESFEPSELQQGDFLVIGYSDINDMSEMTGQSLMHYYRKDNLFTLLTVPTKESLGRYFIYRQGRDGALLKLHTESTEDSIEKVYASVLDVEFKEDLGTVTAIKTAAISFII